MSGIVVVDVETSGLDETRHVVLEVAAIDLDTGKTLHFVPQSPITPGGHASSWLWEASPDALAINRYFERRLHTQRLDEDRTVAAWRDLASLLDGKVIAGVNPWFDHRFITKAIGHTGLKHTIPYRLRDLATYAAGVLHLDPATSFSANKIFEFLDITIADTDRHTALGDANATAAAFKKLQEMGS